MDLAAIKDKADFCIRFDDPREYPQTPPDEKAQINFGEKHLLLHLTTNIAVLGRALEKRDHDPRQDLDEKAAVTAAIRKIIVNTLRFASLENISLEDIEQSIRGDWR